MTLAEQTRKFWCAAHFYRHSAKGDRKLAIKCLEQVAADSGERLQDRAVTLLVEIDDAEFKLASNH